MTVVTDIANVIVNTLVQPVVIGPAVEISYTAATGGTITTDGNFKVHIFTANGTFEVTTAGDAAARTDATVVLFIK